MLSLDEQFEAATQELHDNLRAARLAPSTAVVRRHHRRRVAVVTVATIIAALGVLALGIVVTRDVEPTEPGSSVDPIAERLLFPAAASLASVDKVTLGPELGNSAGGLVQAPSGALFRISIGERGGSGITPNVDHRTFNDHDYTVEPINGELAYVALDTCMVISVSESAPNASSWDDDASVLLAAIAIQARTANVVLPTGWESFGAGSAGNLVQLSYTAKIGATLHSVSMMQIIASPVAAITGLVPSDGPLKSVTFNGRPAWTKSSRGVTSLIWQDGANAVALTSSETPIDVLEQIALGSQHNHADDWSHYLATADNLGGTIGTLPPHDTTSTTGCGAPRLSITVAA
jgi:hypothetical protein